MQGYFSQIVGRMEGVPQGNPLSKLAQKGPAVPTIESFDPFAGNRKNEDEGSMVPDSQTERPQPTIKEIYPPNTIREHPQRAINALTPPTVIQERIIEKKPLAVAPNREELPPTNSSIHFPEKNIEKDGFQKGIQHDSISKKPTTVNPPIQSYTLHQIKSTPDNPVQIQPTPAKENHLQTILHRETKTTTIKTEPPTQIQANDPSLTPKSPVPKLLPLENKSTQEAAAISHKQQTAQKGLVIGSLKVEVLPPPTTTVKTNTQKKGNSTNRSVNRTLGNHSGNRLRFGLGQL